MRHLDELGVVVGADHDRVDHAAEHARGVRHRLAAAELHRARIHDDRGSAELAHRHVEGDARTGRVLLEDHRERAAGERPIGIGRAFGETGASRLARGGIGQHRGDRGRAGIGEIEEVADGHVRQPLTVRFEPNGLLEVQSSLGGT